MTVCLKCPASPNPTGKRLILLSERVMGGSDGLSKGGLFTNGETPQIDSHLSYRELAHRRRHHSSRTSLITRAVHIPTCLPFSLAVGVGYSTVIIYLK